MRQMSELLIIILFFVAGTCNWILSILEKDSHYQIIGMLYFIWANLISKEKTDE